MTKNNGFACYAMLIDNETLETIAKHFPDKALEGYEEVIAFLYEEGAIEIESNFDGEAFPLHDTGEVWYTRDAEQFACEELVYFSLRCQPGLFYPAYYSMETVIAELKSHLGMYLPADYDYRKRLRFIVGSYYG